MYSYEDRIRAVKLVKLASARTQARLQVNFFYTKPFGLIQTLLF